MPSAEHSPTTLTARAVTGVSWSALSSLTRQIVSFAASAALARTLGPGVYGLMGMASLVMIFLTNFRQLGTAGAVIQKKELSDTLASSLHWVNCALGALLCVFTFAGAGVIAHLFKEPRLLPIMQVLSVAFFVAGAGTVPSALLARQMQFGKLAAADFASMIIGYGIAIPMALAGFGVWSLVASNLVSGIAATAAYWILSGWWPTRSIDVAAVRSVANFSLNFAGFGIVQFFSRNADNAIIGRRLGTVALGHYQIAYQIFMLPITSITGVIGQVLNPAFSKIQDDNARFRLAYIRSTSIIGLLTFPVAAGLAVVADPLVRVILGPRWLPAIPILQILAPIGLLQSVQGMVGQIFVAKGRTDLMFRMGVVGALVYVTSFIVGVNWGTLGVALAYAIACLLILAYPVWSIPFRLIGLRVREYITVFYGQSIATMIMVAVVLACRGLVRTYGFSPLAELVCAVCTGVLAYTALVLFLRPPALSYIEQILSESHSAIANRAAKALTRLGCADTPGRFKSRRER